MNVATSPFDGVTPVASPGPAVTLLQGRAFCLSLPNGDITPEHPHGLFFLDRRILSRFEVLIDGVHLEGLAVDVRTPFDASFVARAEPPPGNADATLVVERHRSVGRGMRETIRLHNYGMETLDVELTVRIDADFAHLFEVKQGGVELRGDHARRLEGREMCFDRGLDDSHESARVTFSEAPTSEHDGGLTWSVHLDPKSEWTLCCEFTLSRDGVTYEGRFRCGQDDADSFPVREHTIWHAELPDLDTDDDDLTRAVAVAGGDIGSLRIHDPAHPQWAVLAAGAPWYMTVFGRDSLLTAWMTLIADANLSRGVLRTLARLQGSKIDDASDEQPGRILHEIRATDSDELSIEEADVYFGTVDATPLFVMLVGEFARWHPDDPLIDELMDNVDAAMRWLDDFGDLDGDGFVEYQRRSARGLVNQGWKDSWDAIRHADGELAEGPIALCEVQAYTYGAYIARAELAERHGDAGTADVWRERAAVLRSRFDERFWDDELGCYVLALDGDKRPVRVAASNAGHALWAGVALPQRAGRLADTLLSPAMFSGWGVRTLASDARAYNPISYHNGSVWPHDNALIAEGLSRYGFTSHAARILRAQLDITIHNGGRLPELLSGLAREQFAVPAAYPASCIPQAWAAAAPLQWLRTMLRFDVRGAGPDLWIEPRLPDGIARLRLDGVRVAGRFLTLSVEHGRVSIDGAHGIEVHLGRMGANGHRAQ